MKYPSVHGSNFIRFSILIHPSLNSNTLNKGTPQPIEALTSRTPTRTAQLASHSGSLEAAGRSGVSVFWPIFSAPKVAFIPGKIELSSLVPAWSATINIVTNRVKFVFPFSYAKFQIYFTR